MSAIDVHEKMTQNGEGRVGEDLVLTDAAEAKSKLNHLKEQHHHDDPPPPQQQQQQQYLVIVNVSKKANIRQLINAAHAFNFITLIVRSPKVDYDAILSSCDHITAAAAATAAFSSSSPSTFSPSDIIFLDTFDEMISFLSERAIPLVGIEIAEGAVSIDEEAPFKSKSIALMPGNEGTGVHNKHSAATEYCVYIPQYGSGTASLNVYVATTLVLHRYNELFGSITEEGYRTVNTITGPTVAAIDIGSSIT